MAVEEKKAKFMELYLDTAVALADSQAKGSRRPCDTVSGRMPEGHCARMDCRKCRKAYLAHVREQARKEAEELIGGAW